MSIYHFWVGIKSGYKWSSSKDYKLNPLLGERFKYMGYTSDVFWPKKMNTGRLLHKPNSNSRKRQRKNGKNKRLT